MPKKRKYRSSSPQGRNTFLALHRPREKSTQVRNRSGFLLENNSIGLEKMLDPSELEGGAPIVLTSEEEAMIAERSFSREREGSLSGRAA